jgi:hypothetical protein
MTSTRPILRGIRVPFVAGAVALTMALGACGSSNDTSTASTTTAKAADASTTIKAAAGSTTAKAAAGSTTIQAAAGSTTIQAAAGSATAKAGGNASANGQAVSLGEWFVKVDGDVKAGSNTFALTNEGKNAHALAVVKGNTYKDLPLKDNGAVDVDKLGAGALIGKSASVGKEGGTDSLTVDLPAGNYVFFCPIEFGPNSHAKAGQVLSVTVK